MIIVVSIAFIDIFIEIVFGFIASEFGSIWWMLVFRLGGLRVLSRGGLMVVDFICVIIALFLLVLYVRFIGNKYRICF